MTMNRDEARKTIESLNAVGSPVERHVRPWENCREHGPAQPRVWACPTCLVELRRWKSTHAPRLDALEGMLRAAQAEAEAGREAVATLASERAANALLTDEVERLRAALEVSQAATAAAVGKAQWQARTNSELNALQDEVRSLRAAACRRLNDELGA